VVGFFFLRAAWRGTGTVPFERAGTGAGVTEGLAVEEELVVVFFLVVLALVAVARAAGPVASVLAAEAPAVFEVVVEALVVLALTFPLLLSFPVAPFFLFDAPVFFC
jgi:hypothetical protein